MPLATPPSISHLSFNLRGRLNPTGRVFSVNTNTVSRVQGWRLSVLLGTIIDGSMGTNYLSHGGLSLAKETTRLQKKFSGR
jgi:hypothetical protein